jgi:hypothetical protein
MPAQHQETYDQQACQDDQSEVDLPAGILGEAIPPLQWAHHLSVAREQTDRQPDRTDATVPLCHLRRSCSKPENGLCPVTDRPAVML